MRNSIPEKFQLLHKGEEQGKIKADSQDLRNVEKKLEELIHPLRPSQQSNELLNIESGRIDKDSSVNVTD